MIDLRRLRREASCHAGFTLAEMLLAATIFSIIMVGYAGLFNYAIRSWRDTVGRLSVGQNVQGANDRMTIDVRSALPPYTQAVDFNGDKLGFLGLNSNNKLPLTNSQGDELIMHCADYSNSEGSFTSDYGNDIQRRGYWLRREGSTDTRIMYGKGNGKREDIIEAINGGFSSQEGFAYRINGFDVEYYNGSAWVNTWNAGSSGSLPKLVRFSLQVVQGGTSKTLVSITRPYATSTRITL